MAAFTTYSQRSRWLAAQRVNVFVARLDARLAVDTW
jgi:hypothetical protein